jgi:lysophospholipid acyltransferase (LPLAT)-like uncharacterized protein
MNGESVSARLDAKLPMDISAERGFKSARGQDTLERVFRFAKLSTYSAKNRFLIRAADIVFFLLIRIIGGTARWEINGWENWEAANRDLNLPIYVSWHNRVLLSTYFWRHRGIVVMTSQSFDGEYIARFIQRFGYGAARGSSTRGGTGAIVEMVRLMHAGCPAGFTIDGPKGPRYVAKMGAVLLAKKTGQPILPFTVTAKKYLSVSSWDQFQVPLPFTRARVEVAPPIYVARDASEETMLTKRDELQQALDEINKRGEQWRARATKTG